MPRSEPAEEAPMDPETLSARCLWEARRTDLGNQQWVLAADFFRTKDAQEGFWGSKVPPPREETLDGLIARLTHCS